MFAPFTEEQDELRAVVRDYFADVSSEAEVRRVMATDSGYDADVWAQMGAELQLQGIAIPEEFGGQGFGWAELGIVLEEAGAALLCAPLFASVVLAGSAILESGDEDAKAALLPGIADGSTIGTLAFPGDNRRWDETGVTATATKSGESWTVSGTFPEVIDGQNASLFVVPARTDGGDIALFTVDTASAGAAVAGPAVTVEGFHSLDETRRFAHVTLADTPAFLLGAADAGWAAVSHVLDLGAVGLAAEQAGVARRALDDSVAYMKERVQFGQVIGEFQALKHMAADVLIEVESATSASLYALWAAAESPEELPAAASLAAAFCTDASVTAAHQNIQFHGGMGFTWEASPHLYQKRARADQLLLGDAPFHRANLAARTGVTA